MARGSNFYYAGDQNLGVALGQTLGRALFGDPQAAAAQQQAAAEAALTDARTQQALASAGYDTERTTGVRNENVAKGGLGNTLAELYKFTPQQPVSDDPLAALPEPASFDTANFQTNLPAAVAQLAQAGFTDPAKIVAALTGYSGDDSIGRGAIVSQGSTPGENFALTSGRADDIANRDAANDYRKDTAVASINHATDIPVAKIKAGADRDVATINGVTDRDVAKLRPVAKSRPASPATPLSASSYKQLFGDPDNADKPGELARQLANRGWNLSAGAMTDIRSNVLRRYQQTGNPVEAVSETLKLVDERIAAQKAISEGRDEKAVRARFTQLTGQAL